MEEVCKKCRPIVVSFLENILEDVQNPLKALAGRREKALIVVAQNNYNPNPEKWQSGLGYIQYEDTKLVFKNIPSEPSHCVDPRIGKSDSDNKHFILEDSAGNRGVEGRDFEIKYVISIDDLGLLGEALSQLKEDQ